jgi:hypothetical protein
MTDAASFRGFRWIIEARSRTAAEAIAFFLINLRTFNFTCHERVFRTPMRQTSPMSKLVSPYHAGKLGIR